MSGSYKMFAQFHNGAETILLKTDGAGGEDAESKCKESIAAFEKIDDVAGDRLQKRVEGFRLTSEGCEIRYVYFSARSEPKQTSLVQDYSSPNGRFTRVGAYAPGAGAVTLTLDGMSKGNIYKDVEVAEIGCREKLVPVIEKSGKLIEGIQVTVYPRIDNSYEAHCQIDYAFNSALNVPSGY